MPLRSPNAARDATAIGAFFLTAFVIAGGASIAQVYVFKQYDPIFGPGVGLLLLAIPRAGLVIMNACLFSMVLFASNAIAKEHSCRAACLSAILGALSLLNPAYPLWNVSPYVFVVVPIWPVLITLVGFRVAFWCSFLEPPSGDSCSKCGYDMRGSPSTVCPECGLSSNGKS